jgi:hypothetical protein
MNIELRPIFPTLIDKNQSRSPPIGLFITKKCILIIEHSQLLPRKRLMERRRQKTDLHSAHSLLRKIRSQDK